MSIAQKTCVCGSPIPQGGSYHHCISTPEQAAGMTGDYAVMYDGVLVCYSKTEQDAKRDLARHIIQLWDDGMIDDLLAALPSPVLPTAAWAFCNKIKELEQSVAA